MSTTSDQVSVSPPLGIRHLMVWTSLVAIAQAWFRWLNAGRPGDLVVGESMVFFALSLGWTAQIGGVVLWIARRRRGIAFPVHPADRMLVVEGWNHLLRALAVSVTVVGKWHHLFFEYVKPAVVCAVLLVPLVMYFVSFQRTKFIDDIWATILFSAGMIYGGIAGLCFIGQCLPSRTAEAFAALLILGTFLAAVVHVVMLAVGVSQVICRSPAASWTQRVSVVTAVVNIALPFVLFFGALVVRG